ncbi:Pro-Pol polyprotein [Vitis vinifera]|uniref:Pro-Pol polyprotein n=1 Tax=Vitis vinifera TaxID=29760 RepID=A0A438JH25_VITVI|nr:Pro-Pol polyprotein [Vitis vinifera]
MVLRWIQGHWKTRDVKLRPYHAYFELLVGKFDDLSYTHLPRVQNQCADALDTLASMIDIPTDTIVHLLLIESRSILAYCCLIDVAELDDDRASTDRVMREVHAGVYGPHMEGHMLAQWGIDIIGKIFLKSSNGHEFILVFIDYFTKWAEAASYARLTSSGVASFIRSHIICRYGVPHELILDRGVHFRADVDTLLQRYGIQHHRSSTYRPQTNRTVEVANKNIKRTLQRMIETSQDWLKKLDYYSKHAIL